MKLVRVALPSLTHKEHSLLAIDKASKFPFAFAIALKIADGVARELRQLCLTFGVPNIKNIGFA